MKLTHDMSPRQHATMGNINKYGPHDKLSQAFAPNYYQIRQEASPLTLELDLSQICGSSWIKTYEKIKLDAMQQQQRQS